MKNLIVIFGIIVGLSSCNGGGAPAVNGASIDLTGFEVTKVAGTSFHKAVKVDAAEKMVEEGMLENGKRTGTWVVYHPGKDLPKTITNFVNDVYNGIHIVMNERGQVEKMMSYKNNLLDGKYGEYKFGRPVQEISYKDGKYHGISRTFFSNTDKVQQETSYKEGELHGYVSHFNEDGQVVMQYEYKDGKKISGGIVK